MEIKIEKANEVDAAALVALYHDAYSENEKLGFPASASTVDHHEIRNWITESLLYTATDVKSSEIIGAVRLKYNKEWQCYVLSRLAVKSSFKRMGIGRRLMEFGENKLKKMHEKVVRLTVAQNHPYLTSMYKQRGYVIVGERQLIAQPYDELIMEKLL